MTKNIEPEKNNLAQTTDSQIYPLNQGPPKISSLAEVEYLENRSELDVLSWALASFHPKIALASSFGAEDVVLIDMMHKIRNDIRVFTLDTGRLPQETYDLMDAIRDKYGVTVEVFFPDAGTVEKMVQEHGVNLFYRRVEFRKLCCGIRKVEPLGRALRGLDAWITGLRRDQATTRTATRKVELDRDHGIIVKVNPLADWNSKQVWNYIRSNNVPYNKLHDKNFPSIGCEPCTRAVSPGEDPRAGRWWWELSDQKECGLHTESEQ